MSVPQEEAFGRKEQLSHPINSLVWFPYIFNCCNSSTTKTNTVYLSLIGFTVVSRRQLPDKLYQVECLGAQNSKLVPADKVSLRDEIQPLFLFLSLTWHSLTTPHLEGYKDEMQPYLLPHPPHLSLCVVVETGIEEGGH